MNKKHGFGKIFVGMFCCCIFFIGCAAPGNEAVTTTSPLTPHITSSDEPSSDSAASTPVESLESTPVSQNGSDENPGVARVLFCPPTGDDANYIEWKGDLVLFTLFDPDDYQSSKYFVVNVNQIRQEGKIFHVDQPDSVGLELAAAFSPDGEAVAYISDRSPQGSVSNSEQFVYLEHNGTTELLTEAGGSGEWFLDLQWNPSGNQIALIRITERGSILDIVDVESGQRINFFDALENIEEFDWHPDGRQIALLTSDTDGLDNSARNKTISILDIETGDNRRIVEIPTHCSSGLQWSPDGNKLAWSMAVESNWDIFTFDVGQNSLSKVTKETAEETTPSWSPDGEKLVYVSYLESSEPNNKTQEICLVNLSSSHQECLTDSIGEYKSNPGWSPSGDWVIFTSMDKEGKYISIVDLESKAVIRLIKLPNSYVSDRQSP
ncbi:MAG: hypothetical protein WAM60_19525 [Candidatus Promineifilaceae bacterium]